METIGIIFAMEEELSRLLEMIEPYKVIDGVLGRFFTRDLEHNGQQFRLVLTKSGMGKVRAAAHGTEMLVRFSPSVLMSFGLSGAVSDLVGIGDLVVVSSVLQHDFDLGSLTDLSHQLPKESQLAELMHELLIENSDELEKIWSSRVSENFGRKPEIHIGAAITGDRLITSNAERAILKDRFPGALCVDMEIYSVAQVAKLANTPWAGVKIISDEADDSFDPAQVLNFCTEHGSSVLAQVAMWSAGLFVGQSKQEA